MILTKGEYIVYRDRKTLYFKRYHLDMWPQRVAEFKIYHDVKITAVTYQGEQFTRLRMAK